MKAKKMTPCNVAPVKREIVATVTETSAAHATASICIVPPLPPFAGDDAE